MKLSKTKKDQIEKRIIKHKFDSIKEKLGAEIADHVKILVEKELDKYSFEGLEEFLTYTNTVYFGSGATYYEDNNTICVKLDNKIPQPRKNGWSSEWYFKAESEIEKSLIKQRDSLHFRKSEAKEIIRAVLNSCNTDKQLLKTLPEIAPLITDIINTSGEVSIVAIETVEKAKRLLG